MKIAAHTTLTGGENIVDKWKLVLDTYVAESGWSIVDPVLHPIPVGFYMNHEQYKVTANVISLKTGGNITANRVIAGGNLINTVPKSFARIATVSNFAVL